MGLLQCVRDTRKLQKLACVLMQHCKKAFAFCWLGFQSCIHMEGFSQKCFEKTIFYLSTGSRWCVIFAPRGRGGGILALHTIFVQLKHLQIATVLVLVLKHYF